MTMLSPMGQPFQVGIPNIGMQQDLVRYVNSVNIQASQWDIAIDLFHQFVVLGTPPAPQTVQQVVIRAVMSPQHAKALAHILTKSVSDWEERFGALPPLDVLIPPPPEGGTPSD